MGERRFCKPQVAGSTPARGFGTHADRLRADQASEERQALPVCLQGLRSSCDLERDPRIEGPPAVPGDLVRLRSVPPGIVIFPALNSDREPLPAGTQERAPQKAIGGRSPAGQTPGRVAGSIARVSQEWGWTFAEFCKSPAGTMSPGGGPSPESRIVSDLG
jgi:hypothetical protein